MDVLPNGMRRAVLIVAVVLTAGCAHPPPPPPERPPAAVAVDRRAAFAHAVQLIGAERYDEAAVQFQWLLQTYSELGDYHLYFLGRALARTNRAAEAAVQFRRLLAEHPRSVKRDAAALELGRIEATRADPEAARAALHLARAARDRAIAQPASLELARLEITTGDFGAAADLLQHLRRAAPRETVGAQAKAELQRLRRTHPEFTPTGAASLDELRLLLAEHDFTAAEALARTTLGEGSAAERGERLRLHGEALLGLGRVDEAVAAWRSVARSQSGANAAATWFRIGSMLWNRDRDDEALAVFGDVLRRYPRSKKAAEALYATGRIDERAGRAGAAIAAYRKLSALAPRNPLAREARWRIGWIQYTNRQWPAAAASFAALGHGSADDAGVDGLYWQARALAHAGRGTAARALYRRILDEHPTSYYAMWAEQRLGDQTAATLIVSPPPADVTLPPAPDYHFERALELTAARLPALARIELTAYEHEHEGDTPELHRLLQWYPSVDGHAQALRLARRLGSTAGLDAAARQRLSYPLGFWSAVQAATNGQGGKGGPMDPLLVAALIRQESLFDPDARSPADARGLMQLLPSTAQRVAGAPVDASELYDAERNIALGTRYLAQLLAQFRGDQLKALAAYNGGEAAVEKWERRFAGHEGDEFVESISFRETRDYVKRVIEGYREYRRLYGHGS